MVHQTCTECDGYEIDIDMANITEDSFRVLAEAQAAHRETHRYTGPIHIRKQIARKRGNGFYAVKYGPTENGSQTLCGADATTEDMSYGDTRHASGLAYVTCPTCKTIRTK